MPSTKASGLNCAIPAQCALHVLFPVGDVTHGRTRTPIAPGTWTRYLDPDPIESRSQTPASQLFLTGGARGLGTRLRLTHHGVRCSFVVYPYNCTHQKYLDSCFVERDPAHRAGRHSHRWDVEERTRDYLAPSSLHSREGTVRGAPKLLR